MVSPPPTRESGAPVVGAFRWPYLALGGVCVALGYIGLFVPVMPSTVFFLVALWSFQRSSPRLEQWMLDNPLFGQTLRDWREHRSISPSAKRTAIVVLWVGLGVSIWAVQNPAVDALLLVTGLCVTAFLVRCRTKPSGS